MTYENVNNIQRRWTDPEYTNVIITITYNDGTIEMNDKPEADDIYLLWIEYIAENINY